MEAVLTPLILGLDQYATSTVVGAVGGVVAAVGVAVMCWIALAPLTSSEWAEQFGVDDVASPGPDPTEVLEGRPEPVPAGGDEPALETDAPAAADDGAADRDAPTPTAAE